MQYTLKDNPYTSKNLDCSIAHISQDDDTLLEDAAKGESENPVVAYKYPYGYLVYVPEDPEFKESALNYGYSKEFVDLIDKARELNCKYLQLDGDGIVYDDAPQFDW